MIKLAAQFGLPTEAGQRNLRMFPRRASILRSNSLWYADQIWKNWVQEQLLCPSTRPRSGNFGGNRTRAKDGAMQEGTVPCLVLASQSAEETEEDHLGFAVFAFDNVEVDPPYSAAQPPSGSSAGSGLAVHRNRIRFKKYMLNTRNSGRGTADTRHQL